MRQRGLFLFALLLGVLTANVSAQGAVQAVITSEVANIRVLPDFGGTPLGQVPGGYFIDNVNARSAGLDWLRFDFNGTEGWIHISTLSVLQGDISALPVADPRSIPYGGFEAPRSGQTSVTGGTTARVRDWLRVRSGPSTGYVILANAPINTEITMHGRTAAGNWIQINYNGTLGWVSSEWLILPSGFQIAALPVDGIVAEAPPGGDAPEAFIGVLRFMRDRLDLAQPSLDTIRAYWTDSALTGRASCQPYPARPTSINIQPSLLAAYFGTLEPLRIQFDDAMFNVTRAIELFIEACDQPGTQNLVGPAQVQGALEIVSLADRQFLDLRRQLNELIPADAEVGPNECIFGFAGAVDILPVISLGQIIAESFDPRNIAVGYCFDAFEGQTLFLEVVQTENSNGNLLATISPFDNPTNFLTVGTSTIAGQVARLGPITIPTTGRYLLVVSNIEFPEGELLDVNLGVIVYDANSGFGGLAIDPVTGEIITPLVIPPLPTQPSPDQPATCPTTSPTCETLTTCAQAQGCLQVGFFGLDPDNDGIPCEGTLCATFP
jgi:hypothetical protein